MARFIGEADRGQWTLLPERLDDFIDESNPVRVIDVFVDELNLSHRDITGQEFGDQDMAWSEASLLARDVAGMLKPGQHWHLLVCDERDPIYAITVAAKSLVG